MKKPNDVMLTFYQHQETSNTKMLMESTKSVILIVRVVVQDLERLSAELVKIQ